MKVLIDYNGWRKIEDVALEIVLTGKMQLCIMPPLRVDCEPARVPKHNPAINLIVYATGKRTADGLQIFNNLA